MFDITPVYHAFDAEYARRGDMIRSTDGTTGRFVGRRGGVRWIAWNTGDYAVLCDTFDEGLARANVTILAAKCES